MLECTGHAKDHRDDCPPSRLLLGYLHQHYGLRISTTNQPGRTERVCDQFESITVVMDLCIEVRKVEPVRDILLVNFAEVLISLAAQEPGHPRVCIVAVARRCLVLVHCPKRNVQSNRSWRCTTGR
jgi:hypothetical protein